MYDILVARQLVDIVYFGLVSAGVAGEPFGQFYLCDLFEKSAVLADLLLIYSNIAGDDFGFNLIHNRFGILHLLFFFLEEFGSVAFHESSH